MAALPDGVCWRFEAVYSGRGMRLDGRLRQASDPSPKDQSLMHPSMTGGGDSAPRQQR